MTSTLCAVRVFLCVVCLVRTFDMQGRGEENTFTILYINECVSAGMVGIQGKKLMVPKLPLAT